MPWSIAIFEVLLVAAIHIILLVDFPPICQWTNHRRAYSYEPYARHINLSISVLLFGSTFHFPLYQRRIADRWTLGKKVARSV